MGVQSHPNKWSKKAPLLTAQGSARAVVYKNIVYVIGGNGNGELRIGTVESYDPRTDSWTSKPSLLSGKSELSAGVLGDTIVAADGYTTQGDDGDNEALMAGGAAWTALPGDPGPRNGACTGVIGTKLYAVDGNGNDANALVNINESFSLKTNAWKLLANMPVPVTDSGSAVYNGRLYCVGGGGSGVPFSGGIYGDVQVYTP